jgi:hypothetical protein
MAGLCLAVALMVLAASGAGVFLRGDGTYAEGRSVRGESYSYATGGVYRWNARRVVTEGVGWDIATLLLAVPAALVASCLLARGSYRGRLLAVGMFAYFAYQFMEYATYWAFGPLFLLYVAVFACSLAGIAWIAPGMKISSFDRIALGRFPRRGMAALCLLMAALLLIMWVSMVAKASAPGAVPPLLGQTSFVVQAYDLGIIVPLLAFTGVALLRRKAVGYFLGATLVVKAAMMASAISAMILSAWAVEGTLEIAPLVVFAGAAVVSVMLTIRMYANIDPDGAVGRAPGTEAGMRSAEAR